MNARSLIRPSLVFIGMALLFGCENKPTLDTVSDEAFRSSIESMAMSLPLEQRDALGEQMAIIAQHEAKRDIYILTPDVDLVEANFIKNTFHGLSAYEIQKRALEIATRD